MCLGKCCGRKLRDIRMKQVANRLKRLVEVENKMFSPMPIDFVQVLIATVVVFGGFAQLFDFYMDIIVLSNVYFESFKIKEDAIIHDYQISLTILFTSLIATFLAQQSCIIGMKFS